MTLQIKRATRQGVKPLIGLYSESGCGKTYSSLLLARGIVGPSGKILMCDSESGRGSLYADIIPGGYDVIELSEPFSPARYTEVVSTAEKSGADILLFDSASHEWEGIGGVLDMAAENEAKSGKGLHNWTKPKMEHAKMMLRMMQSRLPIIVCLRAKYKSRQIKGTQEMADAGVIRRVDVGKSVVIKDEHTTPIQADDFIFEMTAHGEIMPDHSLRLTKWSHPELKECFPQNAPIEIKHGELIAKWCAGGSTPATTQQTSVAPTADGKLLNTLKRNLWDMTIGIHNGNKAALAQWLWDEGILDDTETLEGCTAERLKTAIEATERKLSTRAQVTA